MEEKIADAPPHDTAAFFSLVKHPLKLNLYLLANLPSAFFSGLKVLAATNHSCTVSVPYKGFTKNPFRSTYFACLSMAAELSTGVLAMANVFQRKPSVSMLLTGMEAKFTKKATGVTYFTCNDGTAITAAVTTTVATGQAHEVRVHTTGKNKAGEVIAEFWFTWSFKAKS